VQILVGGVVIGRVAHHQPRSGYAQLDAHPVKTAMLVVAMRRLDRHPAAHDSIEDLLQIVDQISNAGLDGRAGGQLVERDLQGCLHVRVRCDERASGAVAMIVAAAAAPVREGPWTAQHLRPRTEERGPPIVDARRPSAAFTRDVGPRTGPAAPGRR